MAGNFCSQCGNKILPEQSFCNFCGAARSSGVQKQVQSDPPVQSAIPVEPQDVILAPPAATAKATGLIIGTFVLVVAFFLVVLIFILPSEEDLTLFNSDQVVATTTTVSSEKADNRSPLSIDYGEVPDSIIKRINATADTKEYYDDYTGTATFRGENLDIMAKITGDDTFANIASKYIGKSYKCTAKVDHNIRTYSPDIYSDNDDGSFYVNYYYEDNIKDGIVVSEESGYEEQIKGTYHAAEKAYFLKDGGIYIITVSTIKFDDGKFLAYEIRIELTAAR